jgi:gliding motility-associated-like protein
MRSKIFKILAVVLLVVAGLKSNAQCNNPLTTQWTWNNGQSGIMFAISAKNSVVIDSFDINWDPGTYGYQIYFKAGTFVGFQTTPGSWTLVGSGTATSTVAGGATNLASSINQTLNKYETGSFYITTTTGTPCNYTNGTTVCDSLMGNSDITVHEGYGKAYPFGATFMPREFGGRVYYHCLPTPTYNVLSPPLCNITAGQTTQLYISPPLTGPTFTWTLPAGVTLVGSGNNDTITVQFASAAVTGNVCVDISDCGPIATLCDPLLVAPQIVDAGPDTAICGTTYTMAPNGTYGVWTILSGSGSIATPSQYNTAVTNLGQGPNVFKWFSDPPGCVADSDVVTITVNPIAVAQFSPPDECDGVALNFSDNSYALGGSIIARDWDIDGDGTVDYSGSSFSHTYLAAGTYQASLFSTATGGCVDTVTHDVVVHPNPIADFNNTPQCEGSPMSFLDLSTVATGSVDGWQWSFGDNTPLDYGQNPQHLYDSANFYLVSLLVTTDEGCTAVDYDTIEVYSVPDPLFSVTDTCFNDTFAFEDLSTSIQGVINYWEWDFGDGSPKRYSQDYDYVYSTHSLYNATLTVATDKGCTNSVVLPVKAYPVPVPDYSQLYECEQQEIVFTEDGYVNNMFGSSVIKWKWRFGDGDTASTQEAVHFYQAPGYYDIELTTTSNYGCDAMITKEILVRPKPVAQYLVAGDETCAGNRIDFSDETYFDYTYDSDGVVSWKWLFGDGNTDNVKDPSHVYETGGDYEAVFVVETQYACIDSAFRPVIIYSNPTADYLIDTLENCSPHCAVFIDATTIDGEDSILYNWTFGDGNLGDEVNPTHCYYVEDGTGSHEFNSFLRVETENGCWDTNTFNKPVQVHANPVARFSLSQDSVELLDPTVYLTNYSDGGRYFTWNFGDSNTSTIMDPISHTYAAEGSYEITLYTESEEGCLDETNKTVRVKMHESLFIPSGFTPNGDGINDYFTIQGEGLEEVKIQIFDRWGKMVYEGENDDIRWDGTYKGFLVPAGSYAYVIDYKFVNQVPKQKTGAFIISSSGQDY